MDASAFFCFSGAGANAEASECFYDAGAAAQLESASLVVATAQGTFTTGISLAGAALIQSSTTGQLFVGFSASAIARALAQAQMQTGIPLAGSPKVQAVLQGAFADSLAVSAPPTIQFVDGQPITVDLTGYGQSFVSMLLEWGPKGPPPGWSYNPTTQDASYDGTPLGLTPGSQEIKWWDGNQLVVGDGVGLGGVAIAKPDAAALLSGDTALAGAPQARAAATVTLQTQIRMSGAALARAAGQAALVGLSDLEGNPRAAAAAQAALNTQIAFQGQAFISAAGAGLIGQPTELAGASTVIAQAGGILTTLTTFQGAALDNVLAAGELTIGINMASTAIARAAASAFFASATATRTVLRETAFTDRADNSVRF